MLANIEVNSILSKPTLPTKRSRMVDREENSCGCPKLWLSTPNSPVTNIQGSITTITSPHIVPKDRLHI
jgi:hypothetical protein